MRRRRLMRCMGQSGVMAMMVEQLGLAMMPRCARTASGLISGTTSGTAGSMRNAEELSTTTAPCCTASGAKRLEVLPPAEKSAMSTPLEAVLLELAHGERLAAEWQRLARRARRGEEAQLGERKAPLLETADELDADGAGGADDRNYRRRAG